VAVTYALGVSSLVRVNLPDCVCDVRSRGEQPRARQPAWHWLDVEPRRLKAQNSELVPARVGFLHEIATACTSFSVAESSAKKGDACDTITLTFVTATPAHTERLFTHCQCMTPVHGTVEGVTVEGGGGGGGGGGSSLSEPPH
jgi:hypothetical protein